MLKLIEGKDFELVYANIYHDDIFEFWKKYKKLSKKKDSQEIAWLHNHVQEPHVEFHIQMKLDAILDSLLYEQKNIKLIFNDKIYDKRKHNVFKILADLDSVNNEHTVHLINRFIMTFDLPYNPYTPVFLQTEKDLLEYKKKWTNKNDE